MGLLLPDFIAILCLYVYNINCLTSLKEILRKGDDMPESAESREKRKLKELEGKNVANYQVLLSALVQTSTDRNKAIITLSALSIGLLITILTTIGINGWFQLIFVVLALIFFIAAIILSLRIYELNADHLVYALKGGCALQKII